MAEISPIQGRSTSLPLVQTASKTVAHSITVARSISLGQPDRGIFNRTGSFENSGSITITDAGSFGIRDETGAFTNDGSITINNPGATTNYGIRTDGNFTNASGGSITVDEVDNDGVSVLAGTLTNDGSLDVIVPSTSSGGKDGIDIVSTATLDNNGTVMVESSGTSARLIRVDRQLDQRRHNDAIWR